MCMPWQWPVCWENTPPSYALNYWIWFALGHLVLSVVMEMRDESLWTSGTTPHTHMHASAHVPAQSPHGVLSLPRMLVPSGHRFCPASNMCLPKLSVSLIWGVTFQKSKEHLGAFFPIPFVTWKHYFFSWQGDPLLLFQTESSLSF